jgi:hypothetical protein
MSETSLLLLSEPGPALSVLRRDLDRARTEEGLGALLAAGALREVRELRPAPLMGAANLGALFARELPEVDRRSIRTLLRIADAVSEADGTIDLRALAAFGTARIAVIADAPASERAGMVAAGVLPIAELIRRVRSARETVDAAALRRNESTDRRRDPLAPLGGESSADHASTIARVGALLANARRGWADAGAAVREQARIIAAMFPARELTGGERKTVEENLRIHLSVDPREATTLSRLDLAISFLPGKHVERAGIGALRLAAALDDDDRRAALFDRLRREPLAGDELLELLVAERAPVTRPRATAKGSGAARAENPEQVLPLGLLLVAADAPEPRFADATEPELVEQLVLRASRPGDLVIDPMAGAGGVLTISRRLGRRAEGADILNPPFDPSISSADARTWSPSEPADLAIIHPPVPLEVIYSERYTGRTLAGDLSAMSEESFLAAMESVLAHSLRTVRPGGAIALVAREGRGQGGRLADWPGEIGAIAARVGLVLVDRLYVPFSPARRRALLAREGYRARAAGRALPCVDVVSIYRTPDTKERR